MFWYDFEDSNAPLDWMNQFVLLDLCFDFEGRVCRIFPSNTMELAISGTVYLTMEQFITLQRGLPNMKWSLARGVYP